MADRANRTDGAEHIDWPAEFERTLPEDREAYSGGFRVTRSVAFQRVKRAKEALIR